MKIKKIPVALLLIMAMLMSSAAVTSCSIDLFGGSSRSENRDRDDEEENDDEEDEYETEPSEESSGTSADDNGTSVPDKDPSSSDSETEASESGTQPETESSSADTSGNDGLSDSGNRLLDGIMPSSSTDYLDVGLDSISTSVDGTDYSYDLIRFDPYTSEMYPDLVSGIELYNDSLINYGMHNVRRDLTLRRADDHIMSFIDVLENSDEVMNMWGVNYNVMTGLQLAIGDVIADTQAFCEAAGLGEGNNGQMMTWLVEPYGVTYIMDPMGEEPEFHTVLYRGNEELFTDFFEPCDSYFLTLSDRGTKGYTIDIGNDGTPDQIEFECVYDEYGLIMSFDVIVNGNRTTYSGDGYFEGFSFDYSILCLDGDCYAYVEIGVPSDYSETYVFALSENGATYVDMLGGSVCGIPIEMDNHYQSEFNPAATWVCGCLPTNPGALYHSERVFFLGTYKVLYPCNIAGNGMPVRSRDWGYVCGAPTLTALIDFEAAGHETDSTVTIEAGTQLRIIMYNPELDSVMAMGPEGVGIIYIVEDPDDHTILGPGLPEEEVFGNIQYSS